MNTLELYSIILFLSLFTLVFAVRNPKRHMQPWPLSDWIPAMAGGLGSLLGIVSVLDLVMHPDRIQPAPGPAWQFWLLRFGAALTILTLLAALVVNLGRRIRHSER